jgi:hypothetical protein
MNKNKVINLKSEKITSLFKTSINAKIGRITSAEEPGSDIFKISSTMLPVNTEIITQGLGKKIYAAIERMKKNGIEISVVSAGINRNKSNIRID